MKVRGGCSWREGISGVWLIKHWEPRVTRYRRSNLLYYPSRPASWSSGQSFCLLIKRSRVRFPVLPWGFFLEGEDSYGDHGLGSLVELRFKVPPSTSSPYINIHLIGTT
jgi:hypothetical protein